MDKFSHLLWYIWCGLLWVSEAGANCVYTQCICSETYLICKNRNPGTPTQTTAMPPLAVNLDVANRLPGGVLPNNLTEIYFTNSPITTIDDTAFVGSTATLQTLSFTNCSLTRIPDALLNLKALIYVSLSDTNIQDWNTPVMQSIAPNLVTLSLTNVGMKVWPSWIKKCSKLTELSVSSSLISSIPDDAFDLMTTNLTTLSLNNNMLVAVPRALSNLSNLHILDLQENMISDITWLPHSNVLSSLTLTTNRISDSRQLSDTLHLYAKTLSELELPFNKLTTIPSLYFLTQIGRLDLSNNLISDPHAGSLPPEVYDLDMGYNLFPSIPDVMTMQQSLSSLRLSSNSITDIRAENISPSVTEVYLDSNRITELTDTSFPENCRIFTLNLDNNPVKMISQYAFKNLAQLSDLSLVNSQLTRLPLALSSLTNLLSFDVTNSRNLVCTCDENSLQHWITSLKAEDILGDCGQLSIYNFFKILSPDCPE